MHDLPRALATWCSMVLFALTMLFPAPGLAHEPESRAPGGLEITPDGGTMNVLTGTHVVTFFAVNGLTTNGTWTVACSRTGPLTCGSVLPSNFTLAPGAGREIEVTVTTTGTGTGRITLTATPGNETGFIDINVSSPLPPAAPTVALFNHNGDNIDRGQCLTIGAGENASASCGDLVVVHAMPAFRSANRDRTLTMAYNSAAATARLLVAARVTQPAGSSAPTKIIAVLTVGTSKDSVDYTPIAPGTTRQIVLGRNMSGLATGVYPMTLTVTNVYSGSAPSATVAGRGLVVNRAASEFGRGWSLLGVEQILTVPGDTTQRLWLAGDGSIRLFHQGVALTSGMLTSSGLNSYNAAGTLDGNTATNGWSTNSATSGAFLRVDLGAQPKAVTTLGVFATPDQHAVYDIEYSDNATAWTKVFVGFRPAPGWRRVTWNSVGVHRYWRLFLTNTPGAGGIVSELSFGSTNNFYGAPGDAPDSLVRFNNAGAKWYRRHLKHGGFVELDQGGAHTVTENRVGARTVFGWDTLSTKPRLTTITVPPSGQGLTYTLDYTGTNLLLDKITDPAGRVLNATVNTSGQLVTLLDPDNQDVTFEYDGGLMKLRGNRRNITTRYLFANLARLTTIKIPSGRLTADTDTSVTQIQPWDERGLALSVPGNQAWADTAHARTKILGPRIQTVSADTAVFRVDKWGAPIKIINGIGATTTLLKSEPAVPGQVTQVTFPNGRRALMTYDYRGNLVQVRDSTSHLGSVGLPTRVTTFKYGSTTAPNSPTEVADSIGNSARVTTYTYNSFGLTQGTTDPRGHLTTFEYLTSPTFPSDLRDLVKRIVEDEVQTWVETTTVTDTSFFMHEIPRSFVYDAKGNLKGDTSAAKVVTSYITDVSGRTTEVYDPAGTKTRYKFDPMNRTTEVIKYWQKFTHPGGVNGIPSTCSSTQVSCSDPHVGQPIPNPDTLRSVYSFGPMTLDQTTAPRGVVRNYLYDKRGLVRTETDDYGESKQAFYDLAGNLIRIVTRSSDAIHFFYDALNRRVGMKFPSNNEYADACAGISNCNNIPGDSIGYTYDIMNNLIDVDSDNHYRIQRSYYANGLLKSKIARTPLNLPHDSVSYNYNAQGDVTRITHGNDRTDYVYSATTGDLQTMTVTLGEPANTTKTFSFLWDSLGRRRMITYPADSTQTMTVKYRYDMASILRRVVVTNTHIAGTNIFDGLKLKNRAVTADGRISAQDMICPAGNLPGNPCGTVNGQSNLLQNVYAYNRMGELVTQIRNTLIDQMTYDASGNMTFRHDDVLGESSTFRMAGGHNRLDTTLTAGAIAMVHRYDDNGSRLKDEPTNPNDLRLKWYFYDALGRMRGTFRYVAGEPRPAPRDCIYDAEGQLVAACESGPFMSFDGVNVSGTLMASVSSGDWRMGWRFFHAPGVDEPIMGLYRGGAAADRRILYFVTDGQGRQLAVADSSGTRQASDAPGNDRGDWSYAGTVDKGYGFDAERMEGSVPRLSFFRNRVYDQASGRWTQEDPIGIGGGLNLYQYNGNNPVMFTDPFGLCPPPCLPGGAERYSRMSIGELKSFSEFSQRPILKHSVTVDISMTTLGVTTTLREPDKARMSLGTLAGISAGFLITANTADPDAATLDLGGEHLGLSFGAGVVGGQVGFNLGSPIGVTLPGSWNIGGNSPISTTTAADATRVVPSGTPGGAQRDLNAMLRN